MHHNLFNQFSVIGSLCSFQSLVKAVIRLQGDVHILLSGIICLAVEMLCSLLFDRCLKVVTEVITSIYAPIHWKCQLPVFSLIMRLHCLLLFMFIDETGFLQK